MTSFPSSRCPTADRWARTPGLFLYFGLPGEPALGPPAFMHRPSSLSNPDAPLGHHLQDSTHITFGVLTGGVRYKGLKLDASVFTGREPDENRFDFDRPRFDSWSVRLSLNPSDRIGSPSLSRLSPQPRSARSRGERPTDHGLSDAEPIPWARGRTGRRPSSGGSTRLRGARQPIRSWPIPRRPSDGLPSTPGSSIVQRQAHDLKLDELGDRVLPVGALTAGAAWRLASNRPFPALCGRAGFDLSHVVDAVGAGLWEAALLLRALSPDKPAARFRDGSDGTMSGPKMMRQPAACRGEEHGPQPSSRS